MLPIIIIFSFTTLFLSSLFKFNESLIMAFILASILMIMQIMIKALTKPKKHLKMVQFVNFE